MDLNIKRLLRDLKNPDEDLRTLAAMTLVKVEILDNAVREGVLEALREATHDRNISVRFFARRAIGRLKAEATLEHADDDAAPLANLTAALESEDFEERIAALMKIGTEKKAEFKDRLLVMLRTEPHEFVRATLISTLAGFLEKEEAEALSPYLQDADSRVRANAIEALERLGAEAAIPNLFPCLEDPDNRIRAAAAKALSSFGESKVFGVLRKMLHAAEEWMKGSAIYALSHIRAGESIELLIETASIAPTETRIKAMVALANFHDVAAHSFLRQVTISQTEPLKSAALRALKLMEEKFGPTAPTSSLVKTPAPEVAPAAGPAPKDAAKEAAGDAGKAKAALGRPSKGKPAGDLGRAVTQFFHPGKEEAAAPLSSGAQVRFSLTDLEKEREELLKEAGRVVFEMYQRSDIKLNELLTLCHEVLRMNFFIQKYTEEEEKRTTADKGFFASLRNMFSRNQEVAKSHGQVERYTQKKEQIFLQLGKRAFARMEEPDSDFHPLELDGFFKSWQNLSERLRLSREPQG